MYEDFIVTDRWTAEPLHCVWKGTIVAIATRHADSTDIRFAVNGRPVWIALPNLAWVEQKRRTGNVITDALAAQTISVPLGASRNNSSAGDAAASAWRAASGKTASARAS